jgi:hypothetical protein
VVLVRGGHDDPTARGETLVVAANAGTAPASLSLQLPELAGLRLVPLAVSGLPSGSPVSVAGDGTIVLHVPARAGSVLAPAG